MSADDDFPDPEVTPIAAMWAAYQRQCLPQALPSDERLLARRAFYGSAQALMTLLQRIAELPTRDRAELMTAIDSELAVFLATTGLPTAEEQQT
ncbi:hypothetical protein [Rubrivivax sp. JA1026]|uniref:hypothetical protein n=1 Tax=Rubrivivax sp. JA1026 TaxID=2710888 RepID=UPI0013E8FACF|nr:hypothetical protein [Rubrivivax sp. JA1026]